MQKRQRELQSGAAGAPAAAVVRTPLHPLFRASIHSRQVPAACPPKAYDPLPVAPLLVKKGPAQGTEKSYI